MRLSVRPRGDVFIDFASSTGSLVSSAWMGIVFLFFGLFISHTGEFTRFLHHVGGSYFLFSIWTNFHGSFFRSSSVHGFGFFETIQADSVFFRLFFFYRTLLLVIFFFGISTRFFLSKRASREFTLLILFIHIGGLFRIRFYTFIDLLLALETITLASYVLASFERQNRFSTYGGIQYFLVGSIPSARFLLGFAFFYFQGGSLVIQDLDLLFNSVSFYVQSFFFSFAEQSFLEHNLFFNSNEVLATTALNIDWSQYEKTSFFDFYDIEFLFSSRNPYTTVSFRGFLFVFFNLLFKITAAPFHFWAPSVYSKIPVVSVTFLSIYSKVRIFFFRYSLLTGFLHFFSFVILFVFLFSGILSVLMGRIGALTEKTIKRFFVFSSRGHVGYRLAGFSLFTFEGFVSVFHYLPIYRVSSFLRWFILFVRGRDKTHLVHFSGFKVEHAILSGFFGFLLFSRSGIPPFAGFFVKLDVLSALFDSSFFFVNYVFFILSVGTFFYYLRVVKIIFFDQAKKSSTPIKFSTTLHEEIPQSALQYWIRVSIFLFLFFYLFFVQKPLFLLQNERLFARFN